MRRMIKVKVPSGEVRVRVERKIPGKARCAICKKELHGIPRERRKLSKSEKRVSRPYGGYLCSSCMRKLMKEKVRK